MELWFEDKAYRRKEMIWGWIVILTSIAMVFASILSLGLACQG